MKTSARSHPLVTFLGGLGYLSVILQWLWAGMIVLPVLLKNDTVRLFLLPQHTSHPAPSVTTGSLSLLSLFVAIVVTAIVVLVSVVILIRLPLMIAKTSHKAVAKTSNFVLPVVTHHKRLTPAKKRRLRTEIIVGLKLTACVAPLLLLGVSFFIPPPLAIELVFVVGLWLALSSLVWFGLEYLVAKLLKLPLGDIL